MKELLLIDFIDIKSLKDNRKDFLKAFKNINDNEVIKQYLEKDIEYVTFFNSVKIKDIGLSNDLVIKIIKKNFKYFYTLVNIDNCKDVLNNEDIINKIKQQKDKYQIFITFLDLLNQNSFKNDELCDFFITYIIIQPGRHFVAKIILSKSESVEF